MPDASTQLGRVEPAGGRGRRWWQDARWIAAGLAVLCVGWLLWGLFGPEPPITVSPATTYLTAPLAADGLPDYGAALLESLGPAPKPEDNAAVELLQVMWPLRIDAADLPAVCKALGIPNVAPADPLREPTRDAAAKVTDAMFDAAVVRPWTAAEFPELGTWLDAHEAALDRLVAAMDRPRYWLPSPTLLRPGPQVLIGLLHGDRELADLRTVARLLVCRALGHVGAGRHAAAWRDIRAVYRLGRLLAVPENATQFLSTQLVAIANQAAADMALTRGLLGAADLPADVLAAIRRDLDALGQLPDPADGLATERLTGLDMILWLARRNAGGRAAARRETFGLFGDGASLVNTAYLTSLEWDLMLRNMNAEFDRKAAAVGLPTRAARRTELDRLAEALQERICRSGWAAAGQTLLGCCSRGHRSVLVSDFVVGALLWPFIDGWLDMVTRSQALFELTRTAAALAAWKADRAAGEAPYPETLSALVPRYLPAEPLDPFADKPFIYERRGDGYLLASVDRNGVYDGGDDYRGWIIGGEWQAIEQDVNSDTSDLVVRMPVPPVPASAPAP